MNTYKKIALIAAAVLLLAAMMAVMIGCGKTPAGGDQTSGHTAGQTTGKATGATGETTGQTVDATGTTVQNSGDYDPWETTQSTTGGNGATNPTTGTNPTKPTTGGNTDTTKPTTGSQSTTPTTKPSGTKDPSQVTYADYEAMSGDEQKAFFDTFADPGKFFDWYNAAKEAYDATKNEIIIGGDETIDLGDLIGGKG